MNVLKGKAGGCELGSEFQRFCRESIMHSLLKLNQWPTTRKGPDFVKTAVRFESSQGQLIYYG